ncbi:MULTISPECIES: alpha/beta hydrolase [Burkholderiaceae]|uniref:Esterase/lipase/thioesterase n=1 Tax=Caballeronia sordidicola TaxID=196367 RepID=A0A242M2X8_CABSO|nr:MULTISPECIES: alpha/beta hydrolase [Burkholderiaceae]AMH43572.1 alpha/beta hydrolase [Burkholderia sp. PAMC 26561]OTP65366.1 Esterase/lipase/thioesterase [Caballeronia sordidicola]
MQSTRDSTLSIEEVSITGHAQIIRLRSYHPASKGALLPIVIYFHGGGFVRGSLDMADAAASAIARETPAWVVSVGYSLSPAFPFPAALEDGYRATQWVVANARAQGADAKRIGVAGHDAGGNLATCLAAVARDRGEFVFAAQALLAPLLDPSMTRMADEKEIVDPDLGASECAQCYRAYLPNASQWLHPYAAPIESRRLAGLPPALIASAQHDLLHVEAEKYASELIAAGVPTEVMRHGNASHHELGTHPAALADVVSFFKKRLPAKAQRR